MPTRERTFESAHADVPTSLLGEIGDLLVDCMRLARPCDEATRLLLDAALRLVATCEPVDESNGDTATLMPWQAQLATTLLLAQEPRALPVHDVALACGVNSVRFPRLFKAHFGLLPQQWRLAARIERAKVLMVASRASLTDIAYDCGFAEQSHFTNAFVRLVGQNPSSWRRAHASGIWKPGQHRHGDGPGPTVVE